MEPFQLIYEDKHFIKYLKNGMVVDSGILLEFLKWLYLKDKKPNNLTEEQKRVFDQLERFLSIGCDKFITPHLLAELSNLINREANNSDEFSKFIDLVKEELKHYVEVSISKEEVLSDEIINSFGVADTGMKMMSQKDDKIILTQDDNFCKHCQHVEKLPVVHLNDLDSLFLTLKMFK